MYHRDNIQKEKTMTSNSGKPKLLTDAEASTLEQISSHSSAFGQRAKALLELNNGATQVMAGASAGLTRDQVKYWIAKFRQSRLGIFPESILPTSITAPAADAPQNENTEEKTDDATVAKIKKAKKDKKGKKGKKNNKKGKKEKKEKKGKKEKKKNKEGKKPAKGDKKEGKKTKAPKKKGKKK